jgi:hypothetical protein
MAASWAAKAPEFVKGSASLLLGSGCCQIPAGVAPKDARAKGKKGKETRLQ